MPIQDSTLLFDLAALRENILLDRNQEAFVRATVSSTQNLIAGIDAKIRLIENELSELRKQRDAALETMTIPVALLAPVRRLPPEVLGEIFQRCVPIEPTHVTSFDSRDAPLLLTRICHRWRQVAHGTPLLWNKFVLYGRSPESYFSSMWLNNSGSLPLEISVEEYPNLDSYLGRRFREFGDPIDSEYTGHGWRMDRYMVWVWREGVSDQRPQIVVGQRIRLRRLSLVCAANELGGYFPREAMTIFPSLQELCVKYTQHLDFDRPDYPFQNILAPRLHTLVLTGSAQLLLPALEYMSNLRNLKIRGNCTIELFVGFVSRCLTLQRIEANYISVKAPQEPMDMSPIVLPGLSYFQLDVFYDSAGQSDDGLGVDGEDWSLGAKPLERLRTPDLQQAEIRTLRNYGHFLSNFIADSQSRLHTLKISCVELDASTFNCATSVFTAVERMEFLSCQSSAGFWESLIHAEDMSSHIWTLPKLKSLVLDGLRIAPEHQAGLIRFMERRVPPLRSQRQISLEGICHLEEIELIRCTLSVETLSALERLKANMEGFLITIKECWNPQSDLAVNDWGV